MSIDNIPGRHAMKWIIRDALKHTRPNGIWIEGGCAIGKGVSFMARTLLEAGRHDIQLYAVDPFAGTHRNGEQQTMGKPEDDWGLFLDVMQQHAPEELRRISVLRTTSVLAARLFEDEIVDLVLLDADHSYESVKEEIEAWFPKVSPGGVIGGDDHHDVEFPGVGKACREFFGDDYEVRVDEQDWPTWRHRKRESYISHLARKMAREAR